MFVLATWFLPLALSILWTQLLTWNFHNTWQFCSNTWTCFSSKRFLALPDTFVNCYAQQTFSKLLVFPSHIYTTMSPSPNFACLHCYKVVISFELEQFVEGILFCYFTFLFCFVSCARLAACIFVQLLHNFKQHVVNKFLSEFKHFKRQLTICYLKFFAWSTIQFTFPSVDAQFLYIFCKQFNRTDTSFWRNFEVLGFYDK